MVGTDMILRRSCELTGSNLFCCSNFQNMARRQFHSAWVAFVRRLCFSWSFAGGENTVLLGSPIHKPQTEALSAKLLGVMLLKDKFNSLIQKTACNVMAPSRISVNITLWVDGIELRKRKVNNRVILTPAYAGGQLVGG